MKTIKKHLEKRGIKKILTEQQKAMRMLKRAWNYFNEYGPIDKDTLSEMEDLEEKIEKSYSDMSNFPQWREVLAEIKDSYGTYSNIPRHKENLREMDDTLKDIYWWNYGEIGQKLVENSEHIKDLLKKDYKIMDGHNPVKGKFSNLPLFMHLDLVIYDSNKQLIKGICEVKTTVIKTKHEFNANGACSRFMEEAKRNGIPLFLAVVRLNSLLPTTIMTKNGFVETLEKLKKDSSSYQIEFYKEGEFELKDNVFQIR